MRHPLREILLRAICVSVGVCAAGPTLAAGPPANPGPPIPDAERSMTCLGVALDEATVRPGPDSVVRLELWYSLANFNTVPIDVSPNAFLDRAEESRRAATLLGPDERKALWADCNEDMRRVGETARSREKP